jgi:uncharacterized protein (TIGR03089 family)
VPPVTVPGLLDALVRADPSRPAVTWLDPAGGARVELSRVTLANWVAKIGGLLQDVVEVGSGERVRLRLPAHWLAVAWPLACWSVGALVVPADGAAAADLDVIGDDTLDDTLEDTLDDTPGETGRPPGGRVAVVGLAPLGGRSRRPVPAGAWDAGAEVLGQPDHLVAYDPPGPTTPALAGRDHAGLLAAAHERATALGLPGGGRLATDVAPCTTAGLVETVLAPLAVGGSLVLTTGPDPGALAAERPDALAGSLRG